MLGNNRDLKYCYLNSRVLRETGVIRYHCPFSLR